MKKKIVINLDENLISYIKNKNFILNDKYKLNLEILYNRISQEKVLQKLDILYYQNYATITFEGFVYIFFYKLIPVYFKLIYNDSSENKVDKIFVCSSYEILDYCKKKNYNPYLQINESKYEFKYLFMAFYISKFANSNEIILVQDYSDYDDYKTEKLPSFHLRDNSILEPQKLSKFFGLFFLFETKSNFEYWESNIRKDFISVILGFKTQTDLYCFKICGPSAIGKSMTLFLISRYYNNFLYYNLKTIRKLNEKKENVKIHNIITESCKYLNLDEDQIVKLSTLIKENRLNSFFYCLKKIIEFLIDNNILSVIILDQFKNDSIEKDEYDKIVNLIKAEKKKYVKLLICSSTNDKEIRDECIESWKMKIFLFSQLNEKNQNYYFYIDELYNTNKEEKTNYDKVLNKFHFIPKYKIKFLYLKEDGDKTEKINEDLKEIKKNIEKNLRDLYRLINGKKLSEEIITMKMVQSLKHIDFIIDEQLDYSQLEEYTNICSFKYYRFKFEKDFFRIKYNFPFMNEVVNDIINTHLEEFFKYGRNNEHTGYTTADFFELLSSKLIKNRQLELPESEKAICIKVNEISQMSEFSDNNLINSIQSHIYTSTGEYKVQKKDFIGNNQNLEEELQERNLLLDLKDIINYDVKNIEYYKLDYLNNLNKFHTISGNKNLGDKSIYINQKNQRGKKLDFAYVYGNKKEKIFIGFQTKAYDEEASHSCTFNETKDSLRKTLSPMLVNIKYLMDMDIKSWHYVVIILYNRKKKQGKQYFKKIVETCQNNGLDYIFHEPFENKFYNRYFEEIKKFIPNQFSNLDNSIKTILPNNIMIDSSIDEYMNNFSNYIIKNNLSDAKYIKEGLISLLNKKRNREINLNLTEEDKKVEIKKLLNDITHNIKKTFHFNFAKFVGAYELLEDSLSIPKPQKDYFFLFPTNENGIFFILFNKENRNNDIYYKYNTNIKMDNKRKKGKDKKTDDKKNKECITDVKADDILLNINRKEKFYAFIYEENNVKTE